MKTLYQPFFIKDLKALRSTSIFQQINKLVFKDIPNYQTLDDISNLKKLKVKIMPIGLELVIIE